MKLLFKHRSSWLGVALVWALGTAAIAHAARPDIPDDLDRDFKDWLEIVELLISDDELEYFLAIEEDFRRHAFMEAFWEVRDLDSRTPFNEFRRRWMSRVDQAIEDWGTLQDDRARFFLLNGEPGRFVIGNGQVIDVCYLPSTELEIWFYVGSEQTKQTFAVIFFRPEFRRDLPYQAWVKDRSLQPDRRNRLPTTDPSEFCTDELYQGALRLIAEERFYEFFIEGLMSVPEPRSKEWIASFEAQSTDIPAGAESFDVQLDFEFPGRNQSRTAVQGLLAVSPDAVGARELEGGSVHEFLLVGEVIRDDRLFETFRYQFEMPKREAPAIPLVFQRYLRSGEVEIRVRVEDVFGRRFGHARKQFVVPDAGSLRSVRRVPDSPIFRLLDEANEAAERGLTTVRLVPPSEGEIQLGHVRFLTVISGEVDRVTFLLNDREVMTKREPPYSLELNLGGVAASHRVRVVAFDSEGTERASDEVLINQGGQRFRIRLVEPREDRDYLDSLSAVVQVEVPDGQSLERVEVYLAEDRVATLYQEPFVQAVLLRKPGLTYVRAVGYLEDGNTTEDVVFANAPDYFEQLEVKLVELYATVLNRRGRPILDLPKESFKVFEDGAEQEIKRFEYVRNLPIYAGLLIDTSASMEEGLDQVTAAAHSFVEETIQAKDRLALISFNSRPSVDVRFSNDLPAISAALDGLRPGGSTALYDSLIFALHYFDGVKGQKALMLLSDGIDEASRFGLDNAIETARRAGVTLYVIGMKELAADRRSRETLRDLARATGGRAFFIDDVSSLPGIYARIQEELRSQYLIVYQSTSDKDENEFRRVELKTEDGAEVRTVAGYYP